MPWLLAARRKKLRHLQLLLLLKLRPLLLRLLMQSRLKPLLLLTLPSRLTPLLRLLTLSLLTLPLRPLMQSRLKPLRPSNLRIIFGKNRSQDRFFFVPVLRPCFASLFRVSPRLFLHLRRSFPLPLGIQTELFLDLAQTHQIVPQSLRSNPSICTY